MNTRNEDIMLPYLVIARFNGLKKEVPDDPDNMVWVSETGDRYVLTPKGFSPSVLLNYKVYYDSVRREYDKLSASLNEYKSRLEQCKYEQKKYAKAGKDLRALMDIISSDGDTEEKMKEIIKYLKSSR